MEVVVNIPKSRYEYYLTLAKKCEQLNPMEKAVLNGTILPETHGRLVDASVIHDKMHELVQTQGNLDYSDVVSILDRSDTLVEPYTHGVDPEDFGEAFWILTIEDWNRWTCSRCGHFERTDIHVTLGYNFCPKCGRHMIGVRHNLDTDNICIQFDQCTRY